jgi:hypothetical protein
MVGHIFYQITQMYAIIGLKIFSPNVLLSFFYKRITFTIISVNKALIGT